MATDTSTIGNTYKEEASHPSTEEIQAFGFWLYLMSDLILFATLFATFIVLRGNYAGGPTGKELFHLSDTLAETLLLLFSSFMYGLVMLAVNGDRMKYVLGGLALTFCLALDSFLWKLRSFIV